MKRIYASLGMAAIGVASIQTLHGQSVDTSKPWSASASLRGFYDDNPSGLKSSSNPKGNFGFEVSPMLTLSLRPTEQTTLSAGYTYSYKQYDHVLPGTTGRDRQTHTFNALLNHTFSPRLSLSVQDSFAIGQEPDVLRIANDAGYPTLEPIPGNNIRNYGAINLDAQITPLLGVEVGYANSFFDYTDRTPFSLSPFVYAGAGAQLNRIENMAHIDARWNLQPETVGLIGYQFSWVDYTANLPIGYSLLTGNNILSDSRNNRSHYIYVGLEHSFRPDLSGSIRAGARFNDYYNAYNQQTSVSPYAQASLSYHYAQGSHVDLGVSHDRSASYLFYPIETGGDTTLDSDATVAYLSLTHQIVPNLFGSVIGTYQYATFNGGSLNNEDEQFYTAGVNLKYRFNRHVSANVGYNYDRVEASSVYVNQFERNRAYIGATFVY